MFIVCVDTSFYMFGYFQAQSSVIGVAAMFGME